MATPARAFALVLLLALQGCAGAAKAPGSDAAAGPVDRVRADVEALTDPAMQGRLTGSEGERLATDYVAQAFAEAGLSPAGSDGSWFQPFEFTAGVTLGASNTLRSEDLRLGSSREYALDADWRPLAFSRTGEAPGAPVVFAGYGIVAPRNGEAPAYDSYAGLDVTGRWVLVLRHAPQEVAPAARQHWSRYASLRQKLMLARDRGALGVLVVSGPRSGVRHQLVSLQNDFAAGGAASVFALSLADAPAEAWLGSAGRSLEELQAALDRGEPRPGFEIPRLRLEARVELVQERRAGRNVLARLRTARGGAAAPVLIGAHVDHLGTGLEGSSLAHEDERGQVHPGADDNASGVAAMLEIARELVALQRAHPDAFARDVLFAAWSGEEIGLIGSSAFASELPDPAALAHGAPPALAAVLNLDMVGRMRDHLILGGVGSSSVWPPLIEAANASRGLDADAPGRELPADRRDQLLPEGHPGALGLHGRARRLPHAARHARQARLRGARDGGRSLRPESARRSQRARSRPTTRRRKRRAAGAAGGPARLPRHDPELRRGARPGPDALRCRAGRSGRAGGAARGRSRGRARGPRDRERLRLHLRARHARDRQARADHRAARRRAHPPRGHSGVAGVEPAAGSGARASSRRRYATPSVSLANSPGELRLVAGAQDRREGRSGRAPQRDQVAALHQRPRRGAHHLELARALEQPVAGCEGLGARRAPRVVGRGHAHQPVDAPDPAREAPDRGVARRLTV